MKLLRGIIQPPFKDRKHPERYDRGGKLDDDSDLDLTGLQTKSKRKIQPLDTETNKLSREEQLQKMNALANEFNFYAMDKPT